MPTDQEGGGDLPPFDKVEREGAEELSQAVDELVQQAVANRGRVDLERLQRLGPAAGKLFVERLAAKAVPPESAEPAAIKPPQRVGNASLKPSATVSPAPVAQSAGAAAKLRQAPSNVPDRPTASPAAESRSSAGPAAVAGGAPAPGGRAGAVNISARSSAAAEPSTPAQRTALAKRLEPANELDTGATAQRKTNVGDAKQSAAHASGGAERAKPSGTPTQSAAGQLAKAPTGTAKGQGGPSPAPQSPPKRSARAAPPTSEANERRPAPPAMVRPRSSSPVSEGWAHQRRPRSSLHTEALRSGLWVVIALTALAAIALALSH